VSLRIIAGRHRGRRLTAPSGLTVRPTGERAREALFSILEHGSPPLRGSRFLDLFAGSGAVGLEALSRGASEVLLLDQASTAVEAIAANLATLGETKRAQVLRADACRLGRAPRPFDIAFLDPPYGSGLLTPALHGLLAGGWLTADARIVGEIAAREPIATVSGLLVEEERRYGAARFAFLRPEAASRRPEPS
jgi:16S rRNA (guanine966-N2)-methyltransferase